MTTSQTKIRHCSTYTNNYLHVTYHSHSLSTQTWLKLNPSNHVITDQSLITTFTWWLDTANKITANCSIIFRYHHNWLPMFHLTKHQSLNKLLNHWYHFFFVVFNWTVVPLETLEWDSHFLNLKCPSHTPTLYSPTLSCFTIITQVFPG